MRMPWSHLWILVLSVSLALANARGDTSLKNEKSPISHEGTVVADSPRATHPMASPPLAESDPIVKLARAMTSESFQREILKASQRTPVIHAIFLKPENRIGSELWLAMDVVIEGKKLEVYAFADYKGEAASVHPRPATKAFVERIKGSYRSLGKAELGFANGLLQPGALSELKRFSGNKLNVKSVSVTSIHDGIKRYTIEATDPGQAPFSFLEAR